MRYIPKFVSRWAARIAEAPPESPARNMRLRGYDAGNLSRLTAGWLSDLSSIDSDINNSWNVILARAKDLAQNNSYAKRFLSLCSMNVVGPDGFMFQNRARDNNGALDRFANTLIERKWGEWCKAASCTVTGQLSFRAVCDLTITTAARDGEFLIRKIRSPQRPFGFTLQLLEPAFLDHRYNAVLDNGNVIRMGVEIDQWRRPVAYHLRKNNPTMELYAGILSTGERERIAASEIYHGFMPEWAFQTRGVSWLTPAMLHLNMLKRYELASLVNAIVSAAKLGYFKPDKENQTDYKGDDVDAEDNRIVDADIGSFGELEAGMSIEKWDPQYPHEQHEMFVRSTLRGISSGLGASYNMMANDLTSVNYSSIRAGLLDEREQWKKMQRWLIETLLEPVFTDWLEMAMLAGELGTLPFSKLAKFNAPEFIGRRWAWVDPLKDITASILEIQAGLNTATSVLAEKGRDLEETYEQLAEEKLLAQQYNLTLKLEELKNAIAASAAADQADNQNNPAKRSIPDDEHEAEARAMAILEDARRILADADNVIHLRKNGYHKETA